jgi:hypothetical protein
MNLKIPIISTKLDELLDWLLQLAEVQELLSKYRCADAFHLLNTLKPRLFQLPLSMELHARVFFENGEYKRACEVGFLNINN